MKSRRMSAARRVVAAAFVGGVLSAGTARAGFSGTDVFVPAVARADGAGGSHFTSTLWVTNLGSAIATYRIEFLKQGQPNPSPLLLRDSLLSGATRRYDDIVTTLGTSGGGALHIVSDQELFVSSRTYDLPAGAPLKDAKGLFFSGIPGGMSIGLGQTTRLQGVMNGPVESYRYNFGIVETSGQPATVAVKLRNPDGTETNEVVYVLGAFEAKQVNSFAGFSPAVDTTNAILEASVVSGAGRVILYGTQIAGTPDDPGSNDSAGFEMSFRNELLGGLGGVTSLNGLAGALTLAAGDNVTITPSGSTLTISAAGGGTGGGTITGVTAGAGLAGGGTSGNVALGIANGGVGTAQIADASVTAAKVSASGSTSGQVLTSMGTGVGWSTPAGGGGALSLPYHGTSTSGAFPAFWITNSGSGPSAVLGETSFSTGVGVLGRNTAARGPGVSGEGLEGGVYGTTSGGYGVSGLSKSGSGVLGTSTSGDGVRGVSASGYGVHGKTTSSWAVLGEANTAAAVRGVSVSSDGVQGESTFGFGVRGIGSANHAVFASGSFGGTGAKYFVEPHPTDPSKEIRYVCLEGPESGTYFRGTARTQHGVATIVVPETFRMVSSEQGLTVVVTPIGELATVACVRKSLDTIVVRSSVDVEFDYVVNGVRKAFEGFDPIAENRDFVPRSAKDDRFTVGMPAESIRRLKANGILNEDGSINEATAERMGWAQRWREQESAAAAK